MSGNESKGSFASASPQTARVSSDGGSASGGAQASGSDDVEGEEQEESSSSNNGDLNIQSALATFRQKWQQELETESQHEIQSSSCLQNHSNAPQSTELQARNLFLRGVENERDGKLYEAIQFYRRAVQLVPDIEFQLYEASKFKSRDKQEAENVEDHVSADEHQNVNPKLDDDDDDDANLLTRIQKVLNDTLCVCEPQYEPKFELIDLRCSGNVTQSRFLYSFMRDCQEDAFPLCATHISVLPMEIILYILRWVVSSDLDMRSLEVCSRVCRGFYLCSRDPEIWKLACARVWGVNLGKLAHYESWRQMFIKRPRVHFGGCYISKATYIRHGENNFQDQFYRPWHLVEYYRYLRFFPEGLVLMLTTPDEPITGLCHLKHRVPKNAAVLTGHYRLHEDRVVLVLHRQEAASKTTLNNRYRNRRRENIQDVDEQTFHLELQIRSYRGRIHVQLVWQQHSVLTRYRNGHESKTTFDLPANRYPSLWFSRVKSYTAESEMPLQ